jgi:hypothetical protein
MRARVRVPCLLRRKCMELHCPGCRAKGRPGSPRRSSPAALPLCTVLVQTPPAPPRRPCISTSRMVPGGSAVPVHACSGLSATTKPVVEQLALQTRKPVPTPPPRPSSTAHARARTCIATATRSEPACTHTHAHAQCGTGPAISAPRWVPRRVRWAGIARRWSLLTVGTTKGTSGAIRWLRALLKTGMSASTNAVSVAHTAREHTRAPRPCVWGGRGWGGGLRTSVPGDAAVETRKDEVAAGKVGRCARHDTEGAHRGG